MAARWKVRIRVHRKNHTGRSERQITDGEQKTAKKEKRKDSHASPEGNDKESRKPFTR